MKLKMLSASLLCLALGASLSLGANCPAPLSKTLSSQANPGVIPLNCTLYENADPRLIASDPLLEDPGRFTDRFTPMTIPNHTARCRSLDICSLDHMPEEVRECAQQNVTQRSLLQTKLFHSQKRRNS